MEVRRARATVFSIGQRTTSVPVTAGRSASAALLSTTHHGSPCSSVENERTSAVRYLAATQPAGAWHIVSPREDNHEYDVDHRGEQRREQRPGVVIGRRIAGRRRRRTPRRRTATS